MCHRRQEVDTRQTAPSSPSIASRSAHRVLLVRRLAQPDRPQPPAATESTRIEHRCFRATMCLPRRVPGRFVPGAPQAVSRWCESAPVKPSEPRRAARGSQPRPRGRRPRRSARVRRRRLAGSCESAAWRIESTSEAPMISLRMRYSIDARSASTRARSAAHLADSRPPASNTGTETLRPNTPPV